MTIKNKLDALKGAFDKKATGSGDGGDQTWKLKYPFWKMPEDSQAVVRFLPDLDEDNNLQFLVEKLEHELVVNGQTHRIPCLSMFDEDCPICALSRKFYDEKNETLGKKYYRKKSYIGQVIVVESPIEHDQNQLVKLIDFGPAVFKQIQSAFQSGDLEEVPYAFHGGYNFRIKKTKTGQYASYSTSSFSPKQTSLDDDVIEQINLFNLRDYVGVKPERSVVEALLLAEQTGSSAAPKQQKETAKTEEPKTERTETTQAQQPKTEEPVVSKSSSVLEQLRARAKAAKAEE
jgi:hypothetical protein